MTYEEAQGAIESSIKQGLSAEDGSELYLDKELDQLKEDQIRWIASWLAGDSFEQHKERSQSRVSRGMVHWLTQQACFASDQVAMENRTKLSLTGAQATRNIVERAIEVLIGNGLVTAIEEGGEGMWMQIEPPYDETKIEPKP